MKKKEYVISLLDLLIAGSFIAGVLSIAYGLFNFSLGPALAGVFLVIVSLAVTWADKEN